MSRRDAAMARIAAALLSLQTARDLLNDALAQFVSPVSEPEDDTDGNLRREYLDNALGCCHDAAVAVGQAQAAMNVMSVEELAEGEPDEGEGDEE
jgi:hypothetical protein